MSSLEQRLHALGRELAFPPEPDLDATAPAARPFPWRWVALAAAVVALVAAFAVPSARTSILRFFHIQGATVERVETLPPAQERSDAGGLGQRVSQREVERRLGFRLLLPRLDAEPTVYVLDGVLATVLLRVDGRPVLLSEYGAKDYALLRKSVGDKTLVEPVRVAGRPGLWIEGPPHTLSYFNSRGEFRQKTVKIHGNVLLWTRGQVTVRLEGRVSKAQALRLARQIR
ncbi:MAG TPA: hypothetical protein VLK24_06250 [Gaiellaceae bacterium]|nr:hypothetical protein [Gaiellaceae bacterium]